MQVKLRNSLVNFIGDPHFGKKFANVPLHRQGERESAQLAEFQRKLSEKADICVMVGDLFDTYRVDHNVLSEVYLAIANAAIQNPHTKYLMMEGNHDIARDTETVTSFHVLEIMLSRFNNVSFIRETAKIYTTEHNEKILLCPYAVFRTALEEVSEFKDTQFSLVVGHWDTEEIAGEHNLAPLDLLSTMTDIVVTGHVHTAETKEIGGMKFYRTGSLLPYSHSEDPDETWYVTRTIEQIAIDLQTDPNIYKNKCLRVLLIGDELPPENIDCLQFSVKRLESANKDEPLEVKMESFSFKAIWDETFKENEIPEDISEKYYEIYRQEASDE